MKIRFLFDIKDILMKWGMQEDYASIINIGFVFILIIFLAYLSDVITRRVLVNILGKFIRRSASTWDDIFLEKKLFVRISHLAPALILYYSFDYVLVDYPGPTKILQSILRIYMIVISVLVIQSFIVSLGEIYKTLPISKDRPIKGFIQVVLIVVYGIAVILILSILVNESPKVLLTGLGALAAVLILVFKDTILGFVASIQLTANNMVRIGDWISMPKHDADGTITEINLTTVKVQNWDKTISTIPTYALVSESFGNWRGMEESGGRRIKRHINIDMQSVKFCTPEMLNEFKKITCLKEYIDVRQEEIAKFNEMNKIDGSVLVNGRRMTNLGTFRKYLEFFLKDHPMIHNDMTFLVRHLQPTEKGIPLEIYVFSKDQRWANYESIQADIFDHILAVIPHFQLRVFQNPSGEDFKVLSN